MLTKQAMSCHLEFIRANATLKQAAQKMFRKNIGILPVYEGNKLVGMLTDRDITVRATAKGFNPSKTEVRKVMTPKALSCDENWKIQKAAKLMERNRIRRLLVKDHESHRPIGMLSLGDLATHVHGAKLAGEVLERVSQAGKF